jgi:hypothetical protein
MSKKTALILIVSVFMAVVLAACGTARPNFAEVPAGKAYANGDVIYFTHTETSDQGVADLLTQMMKSPVLFVPSLAQAPDSMLTNVYVFKNGLAGSGPLKFQADVFENTPDDAGYTPLRRIVFVTWQDAGQAKELKSAADIQTLAGQNTVTLEKSGVVVNMPFITWKGGKR